MDDGLEELTEAALAKVVELRGGQPRPQQQKMAAAVAQSLTSGHNLVVQAGTGVGKSLGYLTPLVLHAALSGNRQIVATSSLALQRQILTQDAPLAAVTAQELTGKRPTVAVLKGWSNYLCRLRLSASSDSAGLLWDDAFVGEQAAEEVKKLSEWSAETATGDRDDVPFKVGHAAWAQVSVSKRECLGRSCPFMDECFPAIAKNEAFAADVVVTNHAMLGVFAGGNQEVLPEFDALVVDEAHDLPERVRTQGTHQLWPGTVARLARSTRKIDSESSSKLEDAADAFEEALANSRVGLVLRRDEDLVRAIADLDDASRAVRAQIKHADGANEEIAHARVKAGLDAVDDLVDAWGEDQEFSIAWVSQSEGGSRALNIAPLNVAGLLYSTVYSAHTTILTSATLSLGGTFEQVKWESGVGKGPAEYLDVGTPFDAQRQAILYIADQLDPPGREWPSDEALEELLELVTAANGGMLGLFSSWRAAEAATHYLREHTDLKILFQKDDALPALVEEFKADEDACLIGTMTLWQGVDVPGNACRLVVLDKVPFPRPDDPIASARKLAAERSGRSAFQEVFLAPAALSMAQGAGRLLRGIDDRGMVAILDSRLTTKSYGGFIIRTLLPYWATRDREVATRALRRLSSQDVD